MTMWTNNTTYIADLNAAMPANGQFKFPATQNPSADANTLDDYEEGTWTPSVGGTATYTVQTGNYTKIGRLVIFSGVLTINAIGSGSTGTISGLPFTVSGQTAGAVGYFASSVTNYTFVSIYIPSGGTSVQVAAIAAAGASMSAPATFFQNGSQITFSGAFVV